MTLKEAVIGVLEAHGGALTAEEICRQIERDKVCLQKEMVLPPTLRIFYYG